MGVLDMILVVILLDYMVLLQPGPLLEMLFCLFFSYLFLSASGTLLTPYLQATT